jgi:hypothetical protein
MHPANRRRFPHFSEAVRLLVLSMRRRGAAFAAGTVWLLLLIHEFPPAAQPAARFADEAGDEARGQAAQPPQPVQEKIDRALAAGPASITGHATVAEPDPEGGLKVLRPGTNDFTCMPGDPGGVGKPAMCADKVAMQWNSDFEQHKARPSTTVPGIVYMLAGATQRSDSDPFDQVSPPIAIGPHWMIMWPFDPATSGLPTTHKPTGAYIMWAGTPWAHVHIMGAP